MNRRVKGLNGGSLAATTVGREVHLTGAKSDTGEGNCCRMTPTQAKRAGEMLLKAAKEIEGKKP